MPVSRSSILGVVLLVATQAAGAQADAPLESTKQELRQLESAQKNKASPEIPGRLEVETPILDVGGAGNPGSPQWIERRKEDEERARRQKQRKDENWLVNGVERLGRQDDTATTGTATQEAMELEALTSVPDPDDPQYLLKLFDEQEKRGATKNTSPKPRSAPAPDPFAPFLQDWLGTSPVRNQVLHQFEQNNHTTIVPTSGYSYRSGPPGGGDADTAPALQVNAAPRPNPYLVDSITPLQPREISNGLVPLPSAAPSQPGPVPTPAPMVAPSPLPETRAPAKGPPSSQADDKKYFPQLDRF